MPRLIGALLALLLGVLLGRGLGAIDSRIATPDGETPADLPQPSTHESRPSGVLTPLEQPMTPAAAPLSRTLPPMPPPGTRLVDSMAALRQRAEAGDIEAALRLTREQQLCLNALAAVPYLPAKTARALDLEALRCLHQSHCAELPITELNPIAALGLAAMAGDQDAAVAYASAPLQMLGHLPDPTSSLDAWERRTPALLESALGAGHPLALALLADAWTDQPRAAALASLLPRDRERGVSLLWAFLRIPGAERMHAGLSNPADWIRLVEGLGLPPESLPALIAEGDRLYQDRFSRISALDEDLARFRTRVQPFAQGVWRELESLSPGCHAQLHRLPELKDLEDAPSRSLAPW